MKHAKLFVLALALAATTLTGIQARADAPVIAITGTVMSRDGDRLVVRTEKGDLTFDIDKTTEMPATDLPIGSRITVWYDSDDKVTDRMDARKIDLLPADTHTKAPPPTPVDQPQVQTQTQAQTETQVTETQEELPATASPLPLMGATGVLALIAGAFMLRRSRRV